MNLTQTNLGEHFYKLALSDEKVRKAHTERFARVLSLDSTPVEKYPKDMRKPPSGETSAFVKLHDMTTRRAEKKGIPIHGPGSTHYRVADAFDRADELGKRVKPPKLTAGRVALLGGALGAGAVGGKMIYDHYKNKKNNMNKTAEDITYLAFKDELTKLAENPTKKEPVPPKWLTRGAQAAGFMLGAGTGATVGDTLVHKMLKAPTPGMVNAAKALSAGAVGTAGIFLAPKIQKLTEKHLFGKHQDENGSRDDSN